MDEAARRNVRRNIGAPSGDMTAKQSRRATSYRDAGVRLDAADALIRAIRPLCESTRRPGLVGGIGGFAAVFEPPAGRYRKPLILTATDGVGTKLRLAQRLGRHDTIGMDLVAMCANDVLAQGGEPVLFLDYFSCGRLDVATGEAVVAGIAEGCRMAGAALAGGETAEMPGCYPDGEYDLAGFAVGLAEKGRLPTPADVAAGQVIVGVASSGVHANGFSLVHKILDDNDARLDAPFHDAADAASAADAADATLGETLLTPTHIYVRALLPLIEQGRVRALAHITGGGLSANLPRVLPPFHRARVFTKAWTRPRIFDWLQREGRIEEAEMLRVFNCGIGMALIVAGDDCDGVVRDVGQRGFAARVIGEIEKHDEERPSVVYEPISKPEIC